MSDENKYDEQAEEIKTLLLSFDEADHNRGLVLLEETFRKPVASVLVSLAREGPPAYDVLLNPISRQLDELVYGEVWCETLVGVWVNIIAKRFRRNGSLLALLITIAKCRTVDRWRMQKGFDNGVDLEAIAVTPTEHADGLLEEIGLFCDALSEQEQVTLLLGVILTVENGSGRGIRAELVATVAESFHDPGRSATSIARQYTRLRDPKTFSALNWWSHARS